VMDRLANVGPLYSDAMMSFFEEVCIPIRLNPTRRPLCT
jgi:hypothetical protein